MANHQSDRLSWGDTVFLHLERDGMPLNVASVCTFNGEISLPECRSFIESKLPLLPRYMQRVMSAPFGLGLPTWEYDPEFDLRRHIREVKLKHGTMGSLKDLAGKLFSKVMDRRHPLWDMTVVRGLEGNVTGIIFRLHHCMVDGIAGVGLMNVLLDSNPDAARPPKSKIRFRVPQQKDALSSLTTGFVDSYSELVKRILSAMADLLSMAERVSASGDSVDPEDFASLFPEITAFTERLKFNVVYQGPQKFACTQISLDKVKAIRHRCGTSVNDVILALVTATIRQYCEEHGDQVRGRLFRMMVPVNLRGNEKPSGLGNRISLVPVTVPLSIRDPKRLLAAVHRRTEFLKRVHAAELVSLAGGLIGMLPTSVQGLAGPFASRLPVTPFNLVCTNVPGPQFPLYLLGHKMIDWYPYVPVGGEMAVNCAILSYNGSIYFGFSGDVHAAPDLHRLEHLLQSSFRDLQAAVEGSGTTKKQTFRRRKVTRVRNKSGNAQPSQRFQDILRSQSEAKLQPETSPVEEQATVVA